LSLRVYIGWDDRFSTAWDVAAKSARRFGCEVIQLRDDRLRAAGLLTRPTDRRGQMWDINSDAPQSTAFAISRFFVPVLAHDGWCLFADSDVLFLRDPNELLAIADESKAVMVVKREWQAADGLKMDCQPQVGYPRKNWSSVALWNASHPALRRLNIMALNQWPGRDLHAFRFLADDEIGGLPPEWNHLVGIDARRNSPAIVHFTEGTPDLPGYEHCEHAELWRETARA